MKSIYCCSGEKKSPFMYILRAFFPLLPISWHLKADIRKSTVIEPLSCEKPINYVPAWLYTHKVATCHVIYLEFASRQAGNDQTHVMDMEDSRVSALASPIATGNI